jgi:hypothetical protein
VFIAAAIKAEKENTRPRRIIPLRDVFNFSAKDAQPVWCPTILLDECGRLPLGSTAARSGVNLSSNRLSVKTKTAGNTMKVSARLQTTQSPMNAPNVFTG